MFPVNLVFFDLRRRSKRQVNQSLDFPFLCVVVCLSPNFGPEKGETLSLSPLIYALVHTTTLVSPSKKNDTLEAKAVGNMQ